MVTATHPTVARRAAGGLVACSTVVSSAALSRRFAPDVVLWFRRLLIVLAAILTLTAARAAEVRADPVIAAAGDIACDPSDPGYNGGAGTATRCRQRATSDLLVNAGLAAVLPLGDIQYNSASLSNINAVYDPTWGRVRQISRPVLGNHESSGTGYFDYFNGKGAADGPAGPRGKGYYSFDIGSWHLIALNSNCLRPTDTTNVVACGAGSEQEQWLRADLAAHPTSCTLAYWHHPRYSSGHDGSNTFMQPIWEALYDADADIVLTGHSHDYERFAPLGRAGGVDPSRGIRQFVVGTGGAFFTGGLDSLEAYSEVAQNTTFGVLQLILHPTSYDWRFVPIAGGTFTDSGTGVCHGPGSTPPATRPAANAAQDRVPPEISRLELTRSRFGVAPLMISRLKVTRSRFMVDKAGVANRRGPKRGTTFLYRLSEAATIRFTIRRKLIGRQVGGRCQQTTRANRKRRSCTYYKSVGSFTRRGKAGANATRFSGRIGRKALSPAWYRAVLVASDAAGNRSRPKRVSFKVVRG